MKKLVQVDLATIDPAVTLEKKKRAYKKRKVEPVEEVREVVGQKSLPVKVKKPLTEKQLAAIEKRKVTREGKVALLKAEKEKLDEEVRLKAEEVERKKQELAERRRLKREAKKAAEPQKPAIAAEPAQVGEVDCKPTISEVLASMTPEQLGDFDPVDLTPTRSEEAQKPPQAPKRDYVQRFRTYPFGKPAPPAAIRFR